MYCKMDRSLELSPKMHSQFTDEIIKMLRNLNIISVNDFLRKDCTSLATLTKLNFKDILSIRENLVEQFSSKPINSFSCYVNLNSNLLFISSGIKKLDKILNGGFSIGKLTEICGESSVGKTQCFYSLAIYLSQHLNESVYYMNTKNDFEVLRLQQIIKLRGYNIEAAALKVKNHIFIEQIFNIEQLISSLKMLKEDIENEKLKIRCIVIDLFSLLFLPLTMDESRFGYLTYTANLLQSLAKKYSLCVVIINSLYEHFLSKSTNPELGTYWFDVPETRILMKYESYGSEERLMQVMKSSRLKQGVSCIVKVNSKGVF